MMMYRWSVLPRSSSMNRDAENEDQRMQRTETIHPRMLLEMKTKRNENVMERTSETRHRKSRGIMEYPRMLITEVNEIVFEEESLKSFNRM